MEDVLGQIITAAASNNVSIIKKSAQDALELLSLQQGLIRDPAHELREKCVKVVQLCLETRRSKFVALAIQCCHRLLRDDRFHSNFEPLDDSKWLLGQILQATLSFPTQTDDTQVDILKVFLNIACGNVWNMNSRLIIAVLNLASDAFESGNAAVRTAAQAAASQSLRSFVSQLEEETDNEDVEALGFNEIIPIMQFLCCKIDSSECTAHCEHGILFLLECLLTVLSSLPQRVQANPHLRQFVWQKLAPALITVLGTPKVDKHITTRADADAGRGRGSGCLAAAPTFSSLHARAVYSINVELVRLMGAVPTLRPMLESLFHRMLLYPSPAHRLDALRASAELLRSPLRLLDIAGPLNQNGTQISDLSLIRLIMDSIEECRKSDLVILSAAVSCCTAYLEALLEICTGACLPPAAVEDILQLWPNLTDCEYSGPKYYQSVARLPSLYQDRIQKERELEKDEDGEESDSSGIGQKSDCSGETEGPESFDQEVDGEADAAADVPRGLNLEIIDLPIGLGDTERQHARHFIGALHDLLTSMLSMWGNAQIDQALQSFASQYCQGVVRELPITEWAIIVNADGIYLTTLSALLLDLRLYKSGYYSEAGQTPLLTEDEFVDEIQGSGLLVYLSGTWLREVYQAVVSGSLLRAHGYFASETNHSLINLLIDIGGLGTRKQGSEMLWETRRLEVAAQSAQPSAEVSAGLRLARMLLTCCWSSVLWVLAAPLSMKPTRGKRKQQTLRDTVAASLKSLQIAAKLCSLLGVQDRCDAILEHLSAASCSVAAPKRLLSTRDSPPRLTVAAALSLELILQQGLELGSHCPACWPHVFRTVRAVRRLEKAAFNSATALDVAVAPPGVFGQEIAAQEDDEVDVYSFLRSTNGELMVTKYLKNVGYVDVLTAAQTANVLTLLSYMSVELIMDAAYKLNLRALEHFARALCAASRFQLFPPPLRKRSAPIPSNWIQKLLPQCCATAEPYLLDSVGDLMVKCARSSRPLAHVMRLWGVIGPHLTEAACHSDPSVAKKSIELIEAIINTHIKQGAELPYFHFNEALFKPFENLLCLELSENDIQDQIVSCICEFVEGSASEVVSGWRALFGALRSVPSSDAFLDVFKLFLDTKNPLVFCSAAVDCIICLLKHVRSSSRERRSACLHFLQRCEDVLAAVLVMPQPLVFQAAHRIHISDGLLVEPSGTNPKLIPFETTPEDLRNLPQYSYPELAIDNSETHLTLERLDRPSGVLRVWFLLLEGLHSAAVAEDPSFHPPLLDAVYADVLSLTQRPDPEFGIFCVNRLLLPATQNWLRQCMREGKTDLTGPKHALGLLSEIISPCLKLRKDGLENELSLMVKQMMLLLTECSAHTASASTPPSCFRHIITNVGPLFTPQQWRSTVLSLRRSFELTLVPLRQILMAFNYGSHSFYGDYDQVKVAARRDCTSADVLQLKHLAQQVFLLDCRREETEHRVNNDPDQMGERSYTFLLRPVVDPSSGEVIRVSVKELITSLLTHQSLLQVVAGLLLRDSSRLIPSLVNVLLSPGGPSNNAKLPGLLEHLSTADILILLDCLDLSYRAALQFDARPGLKFLVQRVINLERAANLYRLAGAACSVKITLLFELCLFCVTRDHLSADDVKNLQASVEDSSDLKNYLNRLQESFEELCDTYIDVALDHSGAHSAADQAPIFFLNACQDEQIQEIQPRKSESESKPFTFSDFIDTVSASSSSESELEFADENESRKADDEEKEEDGKEETGEISAGEENLNNEESVDVKSVEDTETISKVLDEYKKSKEMQMKRTNPFVPPLVQNSVPPEIEIQRRNSFLKDSEAHRRVWAEMLAGVFQLLNQLTDQEFRVLLPVFFAGIRKVTAYATDSSLKEGVAELFQRVALVYGFGPT